MKMRMFARILTSVPVLLLLFCAPLRAQRGMEAGALSPAPVAGGHSATANFGGTVATTLDVGDGGQLIMSPFITPGASGTVNSVNTYIGSPAASTWGTAIYGTLTLTLTSVDNASGGSTVYHGTITGGAANAYANFYFYVSGFTNGGNNDVMQATASTATTLTMTNAGGVAETIAATAITPGSKICSTTSGSTPAAGWNTLTPAGCGTLSANTVYWAGSTTASNTQQPGDSDFNANCPDLQYGAFFGNASPWPATFAATLFASSANNGRSLNAGCYATYVSLTYNSTATYDLISISPGGCDLGASPCIAPIPPIQSGHTLFVACIPTLNTGTCSGVTTATNGTTTDTLTQRSCATTTGGGSNREVCFYEIDRATAGANSVVCAYNTGGKTYCVVLEIAGTASSSFDQVHIDATLQTSGSFTSGNTGTTGQATELLVGICNNIQTQSPAAAGSFSGTNGWATIYTGGGAGGVPDTLGIFTKTVTSTGAYNVSGTYVTSSSSNGFIPGLMTLK
jgi:hypothetical protein